MFVSYSACYDWLLLTRLRHYHKGTYYGCKLTHAQTFGSGIHAYVTAICLRFCRTDKYFPQANTFLYRLTHSVNKPLIYLQELAIQIHRHLVCEGSPTPVMINKPLTVLDPERDKSLLQTYTKTQKHSPPLTVTPKIIEFPETEVGKVSGKWISIQYGNLKRFWLVIWNSRAATGNGNEQQPIRSGAIYKY